MPNTDADQLEFVSSMLESYRVVRMIHNIRSTIDRGAKVIIAAALTSRTHGEAMHPFAADSAPCPKYPCDPEALGPWMFIVQVPSEGDPYLAFGTEDPGNGMCKPMTRIDENMRKEDLKTLFFLVSHGLFPRLLNCILVLIQSEINYYGKPLLGAMKPPLDEWHAFASALEAGQRGATNG